MVSFVDSLHRRGTHLHREALATVRGLARARKDL